MSNVALIGASGNAGSRILKELSDRGHHVTAIARNPERIAKLPNVVAVKGDLYDADGLAALLRGHDAVISSVLFVDSEPSLLIKAVRISGVKRYLIVGGAGSLEVGPSGARVIDQPWFLDAWKPEARGGAEFLDLLKSVDDLEWSFLSPSAMFVAGTRTGTFRLGKDTLLSNDAGSSISYEDYAVALVDELEKPTHVRQRFTVGY